MYVIYSEHHNDGKMERWYYGTYSNKDQANEVAYNLKEEVADNPEYDNVWYCICAAEDAKNYNINNLPVSLK